jgi:hypothetical protein
MFDNPTYDIGGTSSRSVTTHHGAGIGPGNEIGFFGGFTS